MKTITEVRRSFWTAHPKFKYEERKAWRQNMYSVDVRTAFVDFVDYLRKDGQITERLANRVTL